MTDRSYITNSYHVNVSEEIDAFSKLKFESQFQALSTGGAISYVEVPNMQNNIPAVLGIIRYIYDNIMYAELNTKSDFCQECGFDGEIQIVTDESGKLVWECPKSRQPGREQAECGQENLRLHRNSVLEPGQDPGNQGKGAPFIR